MDRKKKVLIMLLVLGALATVGVGTYATFTAQTTNPGNSFTTGSLVLSDKVTSTCYSAGAAGPTAIVNNNVNSSCNSVAFASLAKPGDSTSANLTLTNEGSLAGAGGLTVSSGACADTATGTYHGNPAGNPLCAALTVQVQDYTDATFTTPVAGHCVYPASSVATCGTSTGTLSGLSNITVVAPMNAGTSVFERVTISLPLATGNAVQGLTSTFDLNWVLAQ